MHWVTCQFEARRFIAGITNVLLEVFASSISSNICHILGQKRNAAYKDQKYCALNESYKISSAIYVALLFLPHIIFIVSLCSANPNQCTGCLFIFKFFTCTFILFRFTRKITTENTCLISNLLENIIKL